MKPIKKLLYFREQEQTGKTKKFNVYSAHSDDFLGEIHWRSGWRCYVISYEDGIDMSLSCNKELNIFMEELENKRTKGKMDKETKKEILKSLKDEQKIVINKRYGGFGLSSKAFELYLKKKGIRWVEKDDDDCYYTISKKEYEKISRECYEKDGDYRNVNGKGYVLIDNDIQRDDEVLVQVVEELGTEANGDHAKLEIVEIPSGVEWEIDESDGMESVEEKHESWG